MVPARGGVGAKAVCSRGAGAPLRLAPGSQRALLSQLRAASPGSPQLGETPPTRKEGGEKPDAGKRARSSEAVGRVPLSAVAWRTRACPQLEAPDDASSEHSWSLTGGR